jgi:hypothetical protein
MSRGRQRRAAQLVPTIAALPEPTPQGLRPAEQAMWDTLIANKPGPWLAENWPLLRELCRHSVYADEIAGELREVRARLAALRERSRADEVPSREEEEARRERNKLLRLHGFQSERIGNLSCKLRLTNQARMTSGRAADQRRRRSGGSRPWEDWGD